MNETTINRQRVWQILCCVLSVTLCLLWLGFIFSNSLKSGTESGAQSAKLHDKLNEIAEGMGIRLELTETAIRKAAHFTEFAILGGLACGIVLSFWSLRRERCLPCAMAWTLSAVPFSALMAGTDEFLQTFSKGRASEWADVLLDTAGACTAVACAELILWILYEKNKSKS